MRLSTKAVKKADAREPKVFWNSPDSTKMPNIRVLMFRYLSIPASEGSCERVFSAAGVVIGDDRHLLDPKAVDCQACIAVNGRLLTKYGFI